MSEANSRYRMVVGFDLSEQSEVALEQAILIAQEHEACDLHVMAVLDDRGGLTGISGGKPDYASAGRTQEALRTVVDKKLLEARSRPVNLFLHARIGNPAKEIVDLAGEAEADLVVVGTHGRHGVSRWVLGSVAERVVRYAPCPVLVARPAPLHEHEEASDRWTPEPPCPRCVEIRRATGGATWWCDQHDHPHLRPHTYSYQSGIAATRSGPAPIL